MTQTYWRRLRVMGLSCLLVLLFAFQLAAQERLLVNGKVFTGNPQRPYAEAVAIRGGKIVAVGSRAEAAASLGSSPEIIDLGGKALLPGLIDSHAHAVSGGISLLSASVENKIRSVDQLASFAAGAKKSGRGMSGEVLVVSGVPLEVWSKIPELNQRFNSEEFATQPVFLRGMDGHTGWSNQALRKRAGLDKVYIAGLAESERKYYGYDPDFTPNGFAVDSGLEIVRKQIPLPDSKRMLEGARAAVEYLHSLGITSWVDIARSESTLAAYRDLAAEKKLTAHVAAFVVVQANDLDPLAETRTLRKKYADVPGLTVPGVKVFADGVAEYPSQSAAMFAPYGITGKTGDLLFDPKKFADLCIQADKEGLIVHTHAIGDRAVAETLNGIAAARKANGNSGLPHTITHLQFIRPSDIPRFKQLGVIASFQLLWASAGTDTIDLLQPYVTPEIYKWQYPARSMLNAGATIAGASDWSVSTPNVFQAIYQAETRKGNKGVLDANEDMPREAMLYAYTVNAARAMNQQDSLGSLDPGKEADLTLLDRDVLTVSPDELRDTKVLWTMVGGEWVYRAKQ
jgi:predicted amidohydrolase YtcJ